MRVQVRKCPFTGKIFEEKDIVQYVLHLLNVRAEHQKIRKEKRVRDTWESWLRESKKSITHVDEIAPWFLENQATIMAAVSAFNTGRPSEAFDSSDKFLGLQLKLKWNDSCSNSHVAPEGKPTNWDGREGTVKGYPGFIGTLNGQLSRGNFDSKYPYGDAYRLVGLKTGSGGGGNKNHGFGVTVFLDDWPGLQAQVDGQLQDAVVDRLKGNFSKVIIGA